MNWLIYDILKQERKITCKNHIILFFKNIALPDIERILLFLQILDMYCTLPAGTRSKPLAF